MTTQEIKTAVESDMSLGYVSANTLLSNFSFLSDQSRKSSAYLSERYIPLYFHLGKYVKSTSFFELGIGLGLPSGVFLKSCKTVKKYLGFQIKNNEYYSSRLAIRNIKFCFKGDIQCLIGDIHSKELEENFDPDLDFVLINEQASYDWHRFYFDFTWQRLKLGGFLLQEFMFTHVNANKAFTDFSKSVNRELVVINGLYGVGILQK